MSGLRKITPISLADDAHASIRDAIVSGTFAPGEKLVETRIAREIGVGRATAREALRRLREEGLVVGTPNRGVFVRELALQDIIDIYNMRTGVETVAMRLATRTGAPTGELWKCVEEMREFARRNDPVSLSDREVAFHEEICRASGNEYICAGFRTIAGVVRLAFACEYTSYADPRLVPEEHAQLVEAIESGDEHASVEALTAHLDIGRSIELARLQFEAPPDHAGERLVSQLGVASWQPTATSDVAERSPSPG
ncbi:MAG TPA: GntR family transcriptional regulator [Conexibacter sp.]|nr:GntR family transcriptional regulator [Conexibacter sp.]